MTTFTYKPAKFTENCDKNGMCLVLMLTRTLNGFAKCLHIYALTIVFNVPQKSVAIQTFYEYIY